MICVVNGFQGHHACRYTTITKRSCICRLDGQMTADAATSEVALTFKRCDDTGCSPSLRIGDMAASLLRLTNISARFHANRENAKELNRLRNISEDTISWCGLECEVAWCHGRKCMCDLQASYREMPPCSFSVWCYRTSGQGLCLQDYWRRI